MWDSTRTSAQGRSEAAGADPGGALASAPPGSAPAASERPWADVRVESHIGLFVDPPDLLHRAEVLPVALAALGRDHDVAGARHVQLAVVVGELDFALDDVGDLVVRALEVTLLHVTLP